MRGFETRADGFALRRVRALGKERLERLLEHDVRAELGGLSLQHELGAQPSPSGGVLGPDALLAKTRDVRRAELALFQRAHRVLLAEREAKPGADDAVAEETLHHRFVLLRRRRVAELVQKAEKVVAFPQAKRHERARQEAPPRRPAPVFVRRLAREAGGDSRARVGRMRRVLRRQLTNLRELGSEHGAAVGVGERSARHARHARRARHAIAIARVARQERLLERARDVSVRGVASDVVEHVRDDDGDPDALVSPLEHGGGVDVGSASLRQASLHGVGLALDLEVRRGVHRELGRLVDGRLEVLREPILDGLLVGGIGGPEDAPGVRGGDEEREREEKREQRARARATAARGGPGTAPGGTAHPGIRSAEVSGESAIAEQREGSSLLTRFIAVSFDMGKNGSRSDRETFSKSLFRSRARSRSSSKSAASRAWSSPSTS